MFTDIMKYNSTPHWSPEQLFKQVFPASFTAVGRQQASYRNTAVRSTDDETWVYVALPGVPRTSIDVSVDGGVLTVGVTHTEGDERPSFVEGGDIKMRWRLDDDHDVDAVEAKLREGVLEVRVPRVKKAVKVIQVE